MTADDPERSIYRATALLAVLVCLVDAVSEGDGTRVALSVLVLLLVGGLAFLDRGRRLRERWVPIRLARRWDCHRSLWPCQHADPPGGAR